MSDGKKSWSMDDIDRLIRETKKDNGSVVENFARTMRLADTVAVETVDAEQKTRVEPIENKENSEETKTIPAAGVHNAYTGDVGISTKTAKQRVADIVNGIKSESKKPDSDKQKTTIFDEPLLPKKEHSMETDENRRRFLEVMKLEDEKEDFDDTKVIERPGFVVKRTKANFAEGLEGIPKILDAEAAKNDRELYKEKQAENESWAEGQMMFTGFDVQEEKPVIISEAEAEKNVQKNRREKISTFKLMGIAEAEGSEAEPDKNIEKLFVPNEPEKKKDKPERTNNAGVEYKNKKDAIRIRGTLYKIKTSSFIKLSVYSIITVILLALNIVSCVTVGYDSKIIEVLNLALILLCIVIGISDINSGVIAIFKKAPDMKSAITVASLAALVQNICALAAETTMGYKAFAVSGCAAAAFALNEAGVFYRHARTYDAFKFCTGKLQDRLYSIQKIEDKNERFEIGRNLLMTSPDIRYSCRAKFPKRLIEQCENDVSADKLQRLLLPLSICGAFLCGIIGALASKDFFTGVSIWAGTVCICVPSFGLMSIQLPLRWANKRLNKTGGLITGQKAVEEYSKSNSIVLDSADLFDTKNCRMHGFKDFKRVRVDDIMLYSAAMVVRSGGPLAEVFSQVVTRRDLLPEVRSFSYEERMGISGWINEQKVVMGNKNMMKHHNFDVDGLEEEKYTHDGRKVIYLAIANSLCAMLVVSYAPNKNLAPFIKRLGKDGVTILLKNNDSNITTDMINETFGVKFTNIKMMNNTAGRIYKKYRNRIREFAKSGIIHDGSSFSFMRSFTMSYTVCGTFKVENLIQLINVIAGIAVAGGLAALKLFSVTGMWPLMLFQIIMTSIAVIAARLRGVF